MKKELSYFWLEYSSVGSRLMLLRMAPNGLSKPNILYKQFLLHQILKYFALLQAVVKGGEQREDRKDFFKKILERP